MFFDNMVSRNIPLEINFLFLFRIQEVLLDRAKSNIPNYPATHAIEKCKCPVEYTGLSCQNPNDGYFRHFPQGEKPNWIDKVIGIAKPCECNRKSTQCDPNTGHCKVSNCETWNNHIVTTKVFQHGLSQT